MKSYVASVLFSTVAFSFSHAVLGVPLTHAQHVDHSEIGMPYAVDFPEFVITADQRFVYAISYVDSIIVIFSRDPVSGRLELVGKVAEDAAQHTGVHNPVRILLSPDDKHIYVRASEPGYGLKRPDGTTETGGGILVFERNPVTGALTLLDNNAADIDQSYDGRGQANHPGGDFIASKDGNYLFFATANSHALTVLKRNANGILSEAQYIPGFITANEWTSAIAMTPDQKHLYLGSSTKDSKGGILHFSRNTTTGMLTYLEPTDHLDAATTFSRLDHMSVSPDGKFLYTITVDNKFQIFTISATGALTYSFTYEFSDPNGFPNELYVANGFTFSNNGKLVYVIDGAAGALLVFGRNLTTGALTYYGAEMHDRDGVIGMHYPNDLKLSGDNLQAIVATEDGLTTFDIFSALAVTNTVSTTQTQATYTLEVENEKGAVAHHTTLTFTAPADSTIVSVSAFATSTQCSNAGNIVTCAIGDLAVNATERVTVTIDTGASAGVASHAEVTADEVDNDPSNNIATSSLATTTPTSPATPTTPTTPTTPATPTPPANNGSGGGGGGGGGGSFGLLALFAVAASAMRRRVIR